MKLSIITINYNNKAGLIKTIDSVINQSFREMQYVVIDGGSTDGSIEIIKENAGSLDYWVSEPDKGIYNAMNKGILVSTGEYLLFLNSGDCLNDLSVLQHTAIYFNGVNEILLGNKYNYRTEKTLSHPDKITLYYCLYKKFFAHQSAFIHRSLFKKYGLYNEQYKINSDYEFFLKALGLNETRYKKIDFVISKFDGNGISSDVANQQLITAEMTDIITRNVPACILEDYNRFSRYGDFKMKYLDSIVDNKFLSKICAGILFVLYKINNLFK